MVRFVDNRGRGYEVSVWDSVLPSPKRPAVRMIQRNDRKASNTSTSASEDGSKKEQGSKKVKEKETKVKVKEKEVEAKAKGNKDMDKEDKKEKKKDEDEKNKKEDDDDEKENKENDDEKGKGKRENEKQKKKGKEQKNGNNTSSAKKSATLVKARKANKQLGDWSEEQDVQLLKLKESDGKKWIDIVLSMGKPKNLLVERYNELKTNLDAEKAHTSGSNEDRASQASAAPPGAWPEAARMVTDLDEDNWSATDPTDCITDPEPQPPVLEVGDKSLTLSEMRQAVRLNDFLEEQKWLFLASKLFDQTGKRFAPEALKRGLSGD